ncbi:D-alanine--poly(phosphoribitol) ligase [Erysipelothrix sp. strain 2 (EsS2-7-Brazil)]|uniref:amino acid adenylation domain-containing protein n=1 Tax=Erysipelothrix sp. strain 2 (EsS2-7-Brazil) TaxID=2500579 RepID=UPI00190BF587|nr:amino acid adenylation domain-containing protein [Erysipelothrix sp. strain 2 (EsS2-7-Brazil)]MBK2403470.1 D-alanine--poly(phosphoribitol) ligase [Erysipelothrix sp. strain 2 (EsS2-7-Brazil)]
MNHILKYLELSAAHYPNKTAVVEPNQSITYRDLKEKACIAGTFFINHFEKNQPIVIFREKGIETLALMFGAAYACCPYVIVDPSQPDDRVISILKTLETHFIVSDEAQKSRIEQLNAQINYIESKSILNGISQEDQIKQRMGSHISTHPLYILFTSGSTGNPKGVVVSHSSVIRFINDFTKTFQFSKDDVIANQAPFDFDVSVKDIYSALRTGATLVLIPKLYFTNPVMLLDYICESNATVLTWAVSALCLVSQLKGLSYRQPNQLRQIMFSGERMPIKHLETWREACPNTTFVNLYGPTEITCNCTYYVLESELKYDEDLPIGIPFYDDEVFLLDDSNSKVVSSNVLGEICVGGLSLALGYFNNKEQTDRVFIQNPLNPYYRDIIYRTGDLGFYNQNGELCIRGRKDFQIKHMGHRIELEEIERKIEEHPSVSRACCVYHEKKYKIYGIYQGNLDVKALISYLETKLPHYMIPNTFIQVHQMPLTKNGKIDRQLLKSEVGIHV